MKEYVKLMRPKHYIKNLLIFSVLIFSENIFNKDLLFINFFNFISFCIMSSAIYIFNDICDIEKDKKHPIKKNRPLASGKISKKRAYIFFIILILFSALLNYIPSIFFLDYSLLYTFICIFIYLFINILYSKWLKNIPIVDIFILSLGFIIRVIYGSVSTGIYISNWLYLTVLSISFYLALGKRRNEYQKNGSKSREVLKYYSKEYLDKFMNSFLTSTFVFYCLWANTMNSTLFLVSCAILIFILMRYSLILDGNSFGDPVDVVTSDKILIVTVLIFCIYMGVVLYAF